ncbi:MAG: flagellar biosynthetic protein FliR [Methylococcaceae bacterium]|nr:flagellar biosynthetic protein FliR [Methylococcaceae bacterium]
MRYGEAQLLGIVAQFVWPFLRIGALFVAMPLFSTHNVPVQVRVLLAAAVAVAVAPNLPPLPAVEMFSLAGFLIAAQQVLIGTLLGFVMHLVFGAVVFGGQNIAFNMGLGFASMVDPQSGVQVPVVAQIYTIVGTLLFLGMDAHLLLIQIVAESFAAIPVGMPAPASDRLWAVCMWSSRLFAAGVLLSLPVVTALLLINLGFGVASRAAPQLNIFSVGFPVSLLMGLLLIWIGLPGVLELFGNLLDEALRLLREWFT